MSSGQLAPPEIIVSHPGTDFDGLASMVAAQKLHPQAICVLQGRMDSNVKEFLSLYGDLFRFVRAKEVDLSSVGHVITVDINRPARLGTLQDLAQRPDMRITVYDHHPVEETQAEFGPQATIRHRPYGSGTSVLVEFLREASIPISPVEATLFALGIAEDTGHLSFNSVTPNDFYVMGFLHECGVQQDLVNRFLTIELDQSQKALLQKLSLNIQKIRIKGLDIAFATARTREMIPEVAVLTRKVQDLENADVMFALVESQGKVIVVGRSRTPAVDCNRILGFLGGGGHASAAAATVPGANLYKLVQDLVDLVREHAAALVVARDIMSSPVRTISPDTTIQEAYEQHLLRSGHSGLVVVDADERLVGIMSRRDFDKALSHNLGHAPVRGYMSRNVIFISEDTSLEEMADLIINHNVGRLPVVFGGKVKGIVTRSDVLRALHSSTIHQDLPAASRHLPEREEALAAQERMPGELKQLLEEIGALGDAMEMPVYMVGGIVRDFILGRPNSDVDLVVEGDALALAKAVASKAQLKVDLHPRFGTAVLTLPDSWNVSSHKLDIATARSEWYDKPGALPSVQEGGTYDDTWRRDFTINTLALRINGRSQGHYGLLVDHWNGLADLRSGVIRMLHPLSFVDDPTRIFRAIRFASRYGFSLEADTEAALMQAVSEGRLRDISGQRLREEVYLLCHEPLPERNLRMAEAMGVFEAIQPGWAPVAPAIATDGILESQLESWSIWVESDQVSRFQLALMSLCCGLAGDQLQELISFFACDTQTQQLLLPTASVGQSVLQQLRDLLSAEVNPPLSRIHHQISGLYPAHFVWLDLVWPAEAVRERVLLRQEAYVSRQIQLEISGKDLLAAGVPSGPVIGRILEQVLDEKIDGLLLGKDKELARALALSQPQRAPT